MPGGPKDRTIGPTADASAESVSPFGETSEAALARWAPHRADAQRRLERIETAAEEHRVRLGDDSLEAATVLGVACGRAPYLANLLARDPGRLARVARDPYLRREKPSEVMAAELTHHIASSIAKAAPPPATGLGPSDELDRVLMHALRTYRADEMVRLGVREIALGSPSEVGAELAHLAEVCLDAAIFHHMTALKEKWGVPRYVADDGTTRDCELVVIGMGKLGGEELNFASDIDLIYVYSSDAGADFDLSMHEFMSRLCKRVTQALSEVTDEDTVFRVDLRLRPEGSQGAIANSLLSLERYYESWGRPWERQAWLKARPCGGSRALGAEVMRTMAPFVYPRHTSPKVVEDVKELNRRIKAELVTRGVEDGYDVKNGVGGIREIEFFVQALQLIHSGQRPALRARSTLGALGQLLFAGLVTEQERQTLEDAYRLLRRIEHFLQLDSGRQTQRLPSEPLALELFAARLGFGSAAELTRELQRTTGQVAELFATLGTEGDGPPARIIALLAGDLSRDDELSLLSELGLRDPIAAHDSLEHARHRANSPFGRAAAGTGARVAPLLLADVLSSPDPDRALRFACELSSRRGTWTSLWRVMDENPNLRRLIASVFGSSEYLARQFIDAPEIGDGLLAAGSGRARLGTARLTEQARARIEEVPAADDEAKWNVLAGFKHAQVLRIGLADIGGELATLEVCHQLSLVAEVCLGQAYDLVRGALVERHGVPRTESGDECALALLALGKLGGRELGYASDLDVVFVYTGEGQSDGRKPLPNVEYMSRIAQRLMRGLHTLHPRGRLYEVDTRLRPSGTKGLLVSSLASWERYHRESAQLWERQALTRLRPVAGDSTLGERAAAIAAECVYGGAAAERPAPAEVRQKLADMRDRIERELGSKRGGADLKTGRGGLVDIEFASQYIQLILGPMVPALRTPSTKDALDAAARAEPALSAPCTLLADAYRFLRRLEHRLRIVHDVSAHTLPEDPLEIDKLARRLGLTDGAALLDTYRHFTGEVRRAYEVVLAWQPEGLC